MSTKSLGSSESSLNTTNTDPESAEKRISVGTLLSTDTVTSSYSMMGGGQPSSLDMSATTDPSNTDSKSVAITVGLSEGESRHKQSRKRDNPIFEWL